MPDTSPPRARRVLFVCSANQCRSPMAEALFKGLLQENIYPPSTWVVQSAGCWASDGYPATPFAILAMLERGLDLSEHRSRAVTQELLEANDLILCMEFEQRTSLRRNYPEAAGRVFLLSEMAGLEEEVADPIGHSLHNFHDCADEMADYMRKGWDEILRLTQ